VEAMARRAEEACTVREGDLVVDIGANIGMFSLWAAEMAGPRGTVVSFEVIPDTFQALEKNAEDVRTRLKDSHAPVFVANVGIGEKSEQRDFAFSLGSTVWSSMHGEAFIEERAHGITELLARMMEQGTDPNLSSGWVMKGVLAVTPAWLLRLLIGGFVGMFTQTRTVKCQLEPLDKALRAVSDLPARVLDPKQPIGFLKVDVEGAEVFVLRGIPSSLYSRVQRVAIEAENKASAAECVSILEREGFRVWTSDNAAADFKSVGMESELTMVYATR
jgi:hypothetical protein